MLGLSKILFLKPDINFSEEKFSIEKSDSKKSIRFGLSAIKGVGAKSIKSVVNVRKENGNFLSVINFSSLSTCQARLPPV